MSMLPEHSPEAVQEAKDRRHVALVTGGAAGIGKAIAERFAAAGYAVALIDIDAVGVSAAAESLRAHAVRTLGLAASVADESAVQSAFDEVVTTFGGIDVLVNNAGVSCVRPSLELSLAEWQRAIDINLTGVFLCARAAGRHMVGRRRRSWAASGVRVTQSRPATFEPIWSRRLSRMNAWTPTPSSAVRRSAAWGDPRRWRNWPSS